jgi:hypothetical protein
VRRLLAARPDEVVVVATGPVIGQFRPGTTGTLAGYGVGVTAGLPVGAPAAGERRYVDHAPAAAIRYGRQVPRLPLGITLGAWLLAGAAVPCSALAVGPETDPAGPGAGLDRPDRRRGLLVMGDGSARRSERAPGYVDPRAPAFDAAVATALATGDAAALRALDPGLGTELLAAGVPAWRVAGHAATGRYDAELLHDAAPYGVGYFVATWIAP